ncbi:hypothetical protein GGR50DRAFT_498911 [Xylaria sp. CBS 124048]|nr:hypothetical protein GGR50DRAFT_498911 [Xylaria sp. CBS 124048]
MDDATGRRRHEPRASSSSTNRYMMHDPHVQRRSFGAATASPYRQPALHTPQNPRAMNNPPSSSYNSYYPESATAYSQPMTQNTMAYPPEYGQESRHQHGYPAYNSMIYNVPQPSAQSSVYDTSPQFPSRQPAALHMMPTDVATPFFSNEPTNGAAAAGLQPQTGTSNTPSIYQHGSPDQRILHHNYSSNMASMGNMTQTDAPEPAIVEQEGPTSTSDKSELDGTHAKYQRALIDVITKINDGNLGAAQGSLLEISKWLTSNVTTLGLTDDVDMLQKDRIRLFRDFNHAWLGLGQKQKDLYQSVYQSNVPLQRHQTLISRAGLKELGDELIRMCDRIERFGLVDYEYGVWERKITNILLECVELYDNNRTPPAGISDSNNKP